MGVSIIDEINTRVYGGGVLEFHTGREFVGAFFFTLNAARTNFAVSGAGHRFLRNADRVESK